VAINTRIARVLHSGHPTDAAQSRQKSLNRFGARTVLKRTQEIQDVLLLALRELTKKFSYNSIRFGPRTPGLLNGALQISGSSVVKKKDALSEPPQGRGSKF
jgi:hypothetical protein